MARTAGVGSGMCVIATLVEEKIASPSGGSILLSSVRLKALGGSVGDWRHVRNVFVSAP
jgi:hypothetical protein